MAKKCASPDFIDPRPTVLKGRVDFPQRGFRTRRITSTNRRAWLEYPNLTLAEQTLGWQLTAPFASDDSQGTLCAERFRAMAVGGEAMLVGRFFIFVTPREIHRRDAEDAEIGINHR